MADSFVAKKLFDMAKKYGSPLCHAYANWDNFPGTVNTLKGYSIEIRQAYAKRENQTIPDAADIAMVCDTIELIFESPHVKTFVLVAGDADYIEVINRLGRHNKEVVFFGLQKCTSRVLKDRLAENMIFIDGELELKAATLKETISGAPDSTIEMIRLIDSLEQCKMPFVGLSFLRDRHGTPQPVISEAISNGILETYKVNNPKNPEFPVTACRLNRADSLVRKIVGGA